METRVVPLEKETLESKVLAHRVHIRTMCADEFIEKHASGTLRKAKRLGMVWQPQYLQERVAYEFGYGFECIPRSRILSGDAITEGDSHPVTEAGWHIERYLNTKVFPEDVLSAKYLHVTPAESPAREGIGMLVEQTSAPFIPKGHVLYALVAEYDTLRMQWKPAMNPF